MNPELWNYVTWSREDARGMWRALVAYLEGQRAAARGEPWMGW